MSSRHTPIVPGSSVSEFSKFVHDFALFLVDGGAVLYCESSNRLCALNNTAAAIWCLLKDGKALTEVRDAVTEELGLSMETAHRYLTDVVEGAKALAAVADEGDNEGQESGKEKRKVESSAGEPTVEWAATHAVRNYALLETQFAVRYPSAELEALIHPTIALLERARSLPNNVEIGFNTEKGTCTVSSSRGEWYSELEPAEIAPATRILILRTALDDMSDSIAIHSASVAYRDSIIMITGAAGAGKTTLTAALIKQGFHYFSEDTIVLSLRDFHASALPFSLTMKQGSWDLLKHQYPELAGLPIHTRRDGRLVQYLRPPAASQVADYSIQQPVKWVVFLKRGISQTPSLEPIGQADFLIRLISKCDFKSPSISKELVQRLVIWTRNIKAFDLHFSELEEAIGLMRYLCGENNS